MTRYAKAVVALLGALATWGLTAAEDNVYTQVEVWGGVLALATAAGVYAWPNTPPSGEPADPSMSEQGHADVPGLIVIAAVCVVCLVIYHLLVR